jgi:hypothetical protein
MMIATSVTHRYIEISLEIDQNIDKPENMRKGRINQFALRTLTNSVFRLYLLISLMTRIAKITHNMVSINTKRGINQITPTNAEKLDNKIAMNTNRISEIR